MANGSRDCTIEDCVNHARTIISLSLSLFLFRKDRLSRLRNTSSHVDVNIVGRRSFINE